MNTLIKQSKSIILFSLFTFLHFHYSHSQIESSDKCLEENLKCYENCLNKFEEGSEEFKSCYAPCEKVYFNCNKEKSKELETFENEKYKIGDIIPEHNIKYLLPCRGGVCYVKYKNKIGFVDSKRKVIIPFRYDEASCHFTGCMQDGLIGLKYKGKWGFVDKDNEVKVPFIYQDVLAFYNIAPVKLNGKWGYIDTSGNIVLPIKFDRTLPIMRGKGKVIIGKKYFSVDKTGKCVENCKLYKKVFAEHN